MNLKVLSTDKEIKNLGVVSSEEEADVLCARAREWISTYGSQQVLDFGRTDMQEREQEETDRAFAKIDAVLMNAPQLILSPIYDSIGFDRIPDEVLRHLVPGSASRRAKWLQLREFDISLTQGVVYFYQ